MTTGIEIPNVSQVLSAVGIKTAEYKSAAAAAVYQETIQVYTESIKQVPVEYGRLRSSASVLAPKNVDNPECVITYGTEYAIFVHERTDLRHTNGKAKYLSDPVHAASAGWSDRIAQRTKQNVSSGIGIGNTQDIIGKDPGEPSKTGRKGAVNKSQTGKGRRK